MPRARDPNAYGDPAEIRRSMPRAPVRRTEAPAARSLGLPELLTLSEFAVLVRRTPRTVRGWVRDGLVPIVRIGRAKLVPRSAATPHLFKRHQADSSGNFDYNIEQLNGVFTQSDTLTTS